jgi:hypothetical protein
MLKKETTLTLGSAEHLRLVFGSSGGNQSIYTKGSIPSKLMHEALQSAHFTMLNPNLVRSGKIKLQQQTAAVIKERIVQAEKLTATDSTVLPAEEQFKEPEPRFNPQKVTDDLIDALEYSIKRASGTAKLDEATDRVVGSRMLRPLDVNVENDILVSFLEDLYFQARLLKVDEASDSLNATSAGETWEFVGSLILRIGVSPIFELHVVACVLMFCPCYFVSCD